MGITIETAPSWRDIARVADGDRMALAPAAWDRTGLASRIVERIVDTGVRAYGVNTGVGALSDIVIDKGAQIRRSRKIILSHACEVGELLARTRSAQSSPRRSPILPTAIPAFARRSWNIC